MTMRFPIVIHKDTDSDYGVTVELSKISGRARRVNVTLPERLLAIMDQYATKRGETRSALIAQATMEFMAAHNESV